MHPLSRLVLAWALCAGAVPAGAAPYRPDSDEQVVEKLPARATDPRIAELNALRQSLRRDPNDVDKAVELARRYYEQTAAEGDPRYVGYAQAALAPWWTQPAPPLPVRVMRGVLQQFNHHFDEALDDLSAVVRADPAEVSAWAWLAAIHMVRAEYALARRDCEGFAAARAPRLLAVACTAYANSMTGRAEQAAAAIRAALQAEPGAPAAQRLWVLTRLAEIDERLGALPEAEAAFREALALDLTDGYLLAAYADFLLDRGRPAEVLALLKDHVRSDTLLLRLALAARAAGERSAAGYARELGARFDAARLRGDATHQKEEARFALGVLGQKARALELAAQNFEVQREAADARVLLEAALAARQPAQAEPALRWMAESGVQSVVLRGLAQQLAALR